MNGPVSHLNEMNHNSQEHESMIKKSLKELNHVRSPKLSLE